MAELPTMNERASSSVRAALDELWQLKLSQNEGIDSDIDIAATFRSGFLEGFSAALTLLDLCATEALPRDSNAESDADEILSEVAGRLKAELARLEQNLQGTKR